MLVVTSLLSTVLAAPIVTQNRPNMLSEIEPVFGNLLRVFIPFASIVLFVLLVLGGIKYITSGPSPQKVEQAKQTLTYAIFGVILLAMAFLILRLIELVTGAQVTNFEIRRFD